MLYAEVNGVNAMIFVVPMYSARVIAGYSRVCASMFSSNAWIVRGSIEIFGPNADLLPAGITFFTFSRAPFDACSELCTPTCDTTHLRSSVHRQSHSQCHSNNTHL